MCSTTSQTPSMDPRLSLPSRTAGNTMTLPLIDSAEEREGCWGRTRVGGVPGTGRGVSWRWSHAKQAISCFRWRMRVGGGLQ